MRLVLGIATVLGVVGRVGERLQKKFVDRGPAEVTSVVDRIARRFGQARIRDYVPILVERISRDELSHRAASTD